MPGAPASSRGDAAPWDATADVEDADPADGATDATADVKDAEPADGATDATADEAPGCSDLAYTVLTDWGGYCPPSEIPCLPGADVNAVVWRTEECFDGTLGCPDLSGFAVDFSTQMLVEVCSIWDGCSALPPQVVQVLECPDAIEVYAERCICGCDDITTVCSYLLVPNNDAPVFAYVTDIPGSMTPEGCCSF
jgi:hypothetical protein